MEIKINVPLIDKISALFSKAAPESEKPRRKEDTTEASLDVGVISFYYKKVKLERTRDSFKELKSPDRK
jgi:ABC-type thiamine transport system substrate-binding protein